MRQYYLGVDGGGTKTVYSLINERNERIYVHKSGSTNHEVIEKGFDGLTSVIKSDLSRLISESNIRISEIVDSFWGISGLDHHYQIERFQRILSTSGLSKYTVCNDGYLGVNAGKTGGVGICCNNGTGVVVCGIDVNNKMMKIGGLGELSGDYGGGLFLSKTVFSCIYKDLYLDTDKTLMTSSFMNKMNVQSREAFLECTKFFEQDSERMTISLLNSMIEAARMDDAVAKEIINKMAACMYEYVSVLITELAFSDTINIVLTGSIHTKLRCEIYERRLKEMLVSSYGNVFEFELLQVEPVEGALNYLRKKHHL